MTDFTPRFHSLSNLQPDDLPLIADARAISSPSLRRLDAPELADVAIVEAFRADHPNAQARLFDRYAPYVERLLIRVMGQDPDIEDLVHDAFLQSFASIHRLRDAEALKPWLTRIAVNVARSCIRKRTRSRWLVFLPHERVPEQLDERCDEAHDLCQRVYAALGSIRSADDRIAFALRHIDGMTLPETAAACGCSIATAKRRVRRGRNAFEKAARRDPELAERFGRVRGAS